MNVKREIAALRQGAQSGNVQRESKKHLWIELPGYRDGVRDAKRGVPEGKRLETLSALTELRREDLSGRFASVRAYLTATKEQVAEVEKKVQADLGRVPAGVKPVSYGLLLMLTCVFGVSAEASLIHGAANALGIGSVWHQYAIALAIVLSAAFFLEVLDTGVTLKGRITGSRLFAPIGVLLTAAMLLVVAWFRLAHLEAIAPDLSERLPMFFKEQRTVTWCFLLLGNTILTLVALGAIGEIEASFRAGRLRLRLRRLARKREGLDLQLAVVDELHKTSIARVGCLDKALRASYAHGRLEGERGAGGGRFRAALAAIGVVVLVFALSSCGASGPPGVAILLDVSQSVEATDSELASAALDVIGVLPRCSAVSISPINARAGSIISERVPCDAAPFDDDLKALYERVSHALKRSLPAWRALGGGSDYHGSLRLASQVLDPHGARYLVVLGDMVDNRATAQRPVKPPNIPVMTFPLAGAQIYIGFVHSPVIDRLADRDRARFEENWKRVFTESGASTVEIRPFGLQGVSQWAEQAIRKPQSVYIKWQTAKVAKR